MAADQAAAGRGAGPNAGRGPEKRAVAAVAGRAVAVAAAAAAGWSAKAAGRSSGQWRQPAWTRPHAVIFGPGPLLRLSAATQASMLEGSYIATGLKKVINQGLAKEPEKSKNWRWKFAGNPYIAITSESCRQ